MRGEREGKEARDSDAGIGSRIGFKSRGESGSAPAKCIETKGG